MNCRLSLLMALFVTIGAAVPSLAQDSAFSARIVAGDCESDTVVADLAALDLPTGPLVGAEDGRTAASSFTTVPIALDALTASEHAVQASESCGPIGGAINPAGALIVVLSGDEGDSGIAYFCPNAADPGQTDVSLFLAPPNDARDVAEPSGDTGSSVAGAASQADLAEEVAAVGEVETPETEPDIAQTGLTADEQTYVDALTANMDVMGESLGRFGDLFINSRLDDPVWYTEVAAELAIWDEQYRQLNALIPPPAFAEIHQKVFDAYTLFVLAGDDAERGLTTFDATAFEDATLKIEQASLLLDEATRLVEELSAERGG